MPTATRSTESTRGAAEVGICAPGDFPDAAIRDVLEQAGHTTVFWHEEPAAAIDACRESAPDILLFGAPRLDATVLKQVGEVNSAGKETKVIVLCKRSGNGEVRKALDVGVRAVVTLSELDAALTAVIEVVRAGQISVPGSRGTELQKRILTSREKQILGLVVIGMTNAEIATKLFLAESTVKSHLSSAFAKLGVASRSEAAALILDPHSGAGLGILTIPSN